MEKYGIMSFKAFKERTMAIARGEYKPHPDEPKRFFEDQETADRYFRNEERQEPEAEPVLMTA
jgi:hypothetical protein